MGRKLKDKGDGDPVTTYFTVKEADQQEELAFIREPALHGFLKESATAQAEQQSLLFQ